MIFYCYTKEGGVNIRRYHIAICDSDLSFATFLRDIINSSEKSDLLVEAFTTFSSLSKYLETKDLDLIITDVFPKNIEKKDEKIYYRGVKCVLFSSERHPEDSNTIFKFQNVRELCNSFHEMIESAEFNPKARRILVCVFSPVARSGKTLLTKALAADDYSGRSLRIAMEDYSDQKISGNCSELLYHIKERSPDILGIISKSKIKRDGYQELILAGLYQDTRDVTKQDLIWFVEKLRESGEFSDIIFDIGSAGLGTFEILEVFDRIYMPILGDEVSRKKVEVFKQLIRDMNLRSILSKIKEVEVPYTDYRSQAMIKTLFDIKREDN